MTTADEALAGETFLRTLHDRMPAAMGQYVLANPLPDGRTSYQVLAEHVAGAQRVLDLGCGDGALLAILGDNGADGLAGVDLSENQLALARQRPELAEADLRQGRAQELPFADNAFDTVISHMALMLMADVEQVIAETARVLKPGGRFAIAVGAGTAPDSGHRMFVELGRPLFAELVQQGRIPPLGDKRTRTRAGLDELLTPAGFEPVTWKQLTLERSGTPEEVWESAVERYYEATLLDNAQLAQLREQFLARAAESSEAGLLTTGARISIATTRLAAPPAQ